jgi:hypothetical protein
MIFMFELMRVIEHTFLNAETVRKAAETSWLMIAAGLQFASGML